jgi:hypothetical protein
MPSYRRGVRTGVLATLAVGLLVLVLHLMTRPAPEPEWVYVGMVPDSATDQVAAGQWPELHESTRVMLECVQRRLKRPLVITSGYRPGDTGWHGQRRAVDIQIRDGADLWALDNACVVCGANGVGNYTRHIHCDTRPGTPVRWAGGASR